MKLLKCSFLHSLATSPLLASNYVLSTLFPNTINVFLRYARHHVLHSYKATGRSTVLYNLDLLVHYDNEEHRQLQHVLEASSFKSTITVTSFLTTSSYWITCARSLGPTVFLLSYIISKIHCTVFLQLSFPKRIHVLIKTYILYFLSHHNISPQEVESCIFLCYMLPEIPENRLK
jgi:hypothetical protein